MVDTGDQDQKRPMQAPRLIEGGVLGIAATIVGTVSGVATFLAKPDGGKLLAPSIAVVAVGTLLILAGLWLWRARDRRVNLSLNFVILAVALCVGLGAAGSIIGIRLNNRPHSRASGAAADPTASTESSPTPTLACGANAGGAGRVTPTLRSVPQGLTVCPVLLNNGQPITGKFTVAGQLLGRPDLYPDIVVVNQADPETCDALGNPSVATFFPARGFSVNTDGTWSFTDTLGYDEAVTIGRNYQILTGPSATISAIKGDRAKWAATHSVSDGYNGMDALPAAAQVIATFRQAPGKYHGKGSPCKNT